MGLLYLVVAMVVVFIVANIKFAPGLISSTEVYVTLIAVLMLEVGILLLIFLQSSNKRVGNTESTSNETFVVDGPIRDLKDDMLERSAFVESLASQVVEFKGPDSFVMGIYGGWGEGKTSVLNLLKNEIRSLHDADKTPSRREIIFIHFDPWHYTDSRTMLAAFYDEITAAVNKEYYYPDLGKALESYKELMLSAVESAGFKISMPKTGVSLEESRKHVQQCIDLLKLRLIIFVDDIDRVDIDGLMKTFQLVKLNADFNNTFFVLSLDPARVRKTLSQNRKDKEFLEKIIQLPIFLPEISQEDIDKYLQGEIEKIIKAEGFSVEALSEFYDKYYREVSSSVATMRSAKRYINALRMSLPPLLKEANITDLLVIEALRVFYPEVFKDILDRKYFYSGKLALFGPYANAKDGLQEKKTKEHFQLLHSRHSRNAPHVATMISILFPDTAEHLEAGLPWKREKEEKRIDTREYFDRYFLQHMRKDAIKDSTVEDWIMRWNNAKEASQKDSLFEELKKEPNENDSLLAQAAEQLLGKAKPSTFLSLLEDKTRSIDKESGRELILYLVRDSKFFTDKGINLINLVGDLVGQQDKGSWQDILKEIVDKAQDISFMMSFLSTYSINMKDTASYAIKRLDKAFLEEHQDVFEFNNCSFVLYQWAAEWQSRNTLNEKTSAYVLGIVSKDKAKFEKLINLYQQDRFPSLKIIVDMEKLTEIAKGYDHNEFVELYNKYKKDIAPRLAQ